MEVCDFYRFLNFVNKNFVVVHDQALLEIEFFIYFLKYFFSKIFIKKLNKIFEFRPKIDAKRQETQNFVIKIERIKTFQI